MNKTSKVLGLLLKALPSFQHSIDRIGRVLKLIESGDVNKTFELRLLGIVIILRQMQVDIYTLLGKINPSADLSDVPGEFAIMRQIGNSRFRFVKGHNGKMLLLANQGTAAHFILQYMHSPGCNIRYAIVRIIDRDGETVRDCKAVAIVGGGDGPADNEFYYDNPDMP